MILTRRMITTISYGTIRDNSFSSLFDSVNGKRRLRSYPSYVLHLLSLLFCTIIELPQLSCASTGGTETLIGIVGKDFVVLAADSSIGSGSIAFTKASNVDKIKLITHPYPIILSQRHHIQQPAVAIAASGDAADADRLLDMLKAHATIYEYQSSAGYDVDYIDIGSSSSSIQEEEGSAGRKINAYDKNLENDISLLSVQSIANLARTQIAYQLRTRTPCNVCLLVAGMMMMMGDYDTADIDLSSSQSHRQLSSPKQLQMQKATTTATTIQEESSSITNDITKHSDIVGVETIEESSDEGVSSQTCFGLRPCLYWLDEYGSIQKVQYGAHGYGSDLVLSLLDQQYKPNLSKEDVVRLVKTCFDQLKTRYIINTHASQPCIKYINRYGCQTITW